MPERGWLMATVMLCAVLAAPAVLPFLLEQGKGDIYLGAWATTLACTLAASVCLFVSTGFIGWQGIPAWCRCLSAASLAALGPLAVNSTLYHTRADLALAAVVLAVTASLADSACLRWPVGLMMTAVACGLDATALVWPIGCLWSGLAYRQGRMIAVALLAAGIGGIFVANLLGWPVLTGYRTQVAFYALHRDVVVLMPIIVLGLAGLPRSRQRRRLGPDARADGCVLGWAAVSVCAMLMAVSGCPVNVRLAALGLWWLMPVGLAELAQMLTRVPHRRSVARDVGMLLALVVAALFLSGLRGWWNGVLLAISY